MISQEYPFLRLYFWTKDSADRISFEYFLILFTVRMSSSACYTTGNGWDYLD